jgi:hypothetical protein
MRHAFIAGRCACRAIPAAHLKLREQAGEETAIFQRPVMVNSSPAGWENANANRS